MVFLRPCQQRLIRGSRQRTGNNVDLIRRRHPQTVFLVHRQVELLHQLIHHTAAAVNNNQRAMMRFTIIDQRGKQTLQRLFAVE